MGTDTDRPYHHGSLREALIAATVMAVAGEGSDIIDSVDFREGNSNLADALRFDPVQ